MSGGPLLPMTVSYGPVACMERFNLHAGFAPLMSNKATMGVCAVIILAICAATYLFY